MYNKHTSLAENTIAWEAVYDDGTSYLQFNKDGSENKYDGIDRSKLRKFNVYLGKKMIFSLALHGNQKLIFRRRSLVRLGKKEGQETREILILIGYHELVDSPEGRRDIFTMNYVHEDGLIELDDHRDNLQLVQQEQ